MFCSNCGSQQNEGVRFCGACGNAMAAASASAATVQAASVAQPAQPAQPLQQSQPMMQPAGQGAPANGYVYAAPPPASGTAVAALVLAFFFPIVGLILGYVAKNEIRNSGGTKGGDGMATAAIALGWIFTAIGVIWIIVAAAGASSYYY